MARTKVDYGIDLGTTNSAIARMEGGEPTIQKTDTLKDTMSSCVYVNKKQAIQAGDVAYNAMKKDRLQAMRGFNEAASNTFIEFKRTMGTDKQYYCANLDKEFSSEDLSAEILKRLKAFVTDEPIDAVVISVPAKFTINQKDATVRAAKELAGFRHVELLQEPIAASMAYGLGAENKDGHWLVFDFGGGTFDAALVKVEEGIMKVIDTEGDNYLGGKNLDFAIVDEIIVPYFRENYAVESIFEDEQKKSIFRHAMKFYAEEAKIQLSFNDTYNVLSDLGDIPGEDDEGEEFELDITIDQSMMREAIGPVFQKAVDICKDLLERNHISGSDLDALVLVGGPTYSPIIREMLAEQIRSPDVSVDPMTVVARGAALYASTISVSDEVRDLRRDSTKLQLELGYEPTTVESQEFITVKLQNGAAENTGAGKVFVELARGDAAWSSGKTEVDETGEVIEVELVNSKPNVFNVVAFDDQGNALEVEPSEFTIIQGSKVGSATLPYSVGIEIKSRATGKLEFRAIRGLEKNQSTPATGTANGLKTQKPIRPGMRDDFLKVPIYEGEHGADGSRAIHHEHVYDAVITGEDLPRLLPEGSLVDLTMKVERERMTMSVFFPDLDFTKDIEVPRNTKQTEVDADWLEGEIRKATQTISILEQEGGAQQEELARVHAELEDERKLFEQDRNDYDRKKEVLNGLRRILKTIDEIQENREWPKTEQELKDVFYQLEETNKRFGNDRTTASVEQFKKSIPDVIKDQNVKNANDMIDMMRQLDFALADEGLGAQMEILYLNSFNQDFDTLDWSDRAKARMILDRGLQIATANPSKEQLRPVIRELFKLLPSADQPILGGGDGSELVG
jgi:molecular chaperone DnaK